MKRRGLFLDRDGVINRDEGYVGTLDRFVFRDGVFPFLRSAQDKGYRLVIVTNQSGVARGLFSQDDYQTVTRYMLKAFREEGVSIDLVLACFEHPQAATPTYCRESFWRKPNAGMILEGAMRLNIDLARSVMIGDSPRDMIAAQQAGIRHAFLIEEGQEGWPSLALFR